MSPAAPNYTTIRDEIRAGPRFAIEHPSRSAAHAELRAEAAELPQDTPHRIERVIDLLATAFTRPVVRRGAGSVGRRADGRGDP